MTENERSLIKEFEEKGLLPWEPGMVAICPDGDHRVVLAVTEAPNEWLYFQETPDGTRRFAPTHCTHAPCDALMGYLVGQFDGWLTLTRNGSDYWANAGRGETLLEALLWAFKAK